LSIYYIAQKFPHRSPQVHITNSYSKNVRVFWLKYGSFEGLDDFSGSFKFVFTMALCLIARHEAKTYGTLPLCNFPIYSKKVFFCNSPAFQHAVSLQRAAGCCHGNWPTANQPRTYLHGTVLL
jgi:hypothetical protein